MRPGVKMRWQHVVVSLQRLEQLPLHVGGRTALVHRGLAHYLRFGDPETIHLYGPVGLPAWARKLQLPERLKTHSDAMFGSLRRVWRDEAGQILGDHNTSPRSGVLEQSCLTDFTWEHWDWRITYSTEERAIFEVLQDVPKHESIYEADVLMAGLVNLRPTRIQKLLSRCASIKVKRLFLALAERHRHVCPITRTFAKSNFWCASCHSSRGRRVLRSKAERQSTFFCATCRACRWISIWHFSRLPTIRQHAGRFPRP